MAQSSFDVVSGYDKAEMNNVYQSIEKEISTRYDFRGTAASIEWLPDKAGIKLTASTTWQLERLIDLTRKKLATKNQSSKLLDLDGIVHESNMKSWQDVPFKRSLTQDQAKKIVAMLKQSHPKLKSQIQGDAVRITGPSRDELQSSQGVLLAADIDAPLQFTNYR